jgi:hypothetical protein
MTGANIVLAAVVLAGHTALAPAAAFGGMTAVHARFAPYPVRARLLGAIGAGLVLCVGLGSVAAAAGLGPVPVVVLVAVVAAIAKLATDAIDSGPPGGLIFVFAVATTAVLPVGWGEAGLQTAVAAGAALVAWLVGMAGWLLFRRRHQEVPPPTSFVVRSDEWSRAAKVGFGVLAAGLLAYALHLGHPYWTMIAADLPAPAKLACIVVALLCGELTVVRNYALAMVFITPLTLLQGALLDQVDVVGMASDRLLDTVLGAVVGLVAAIVGPGRGYRLAAV